MRLLKDGNKRIGDGELLAITLMIAESNPEEKDVMVKLVMNLPVFHTRKRVETGEMDVYREV